MGIRLPAAITLVGTTTAQYFQPHLIVVLAAAVSLAAHVPLAKSQDASSITINLIPYKGNPILDKGPQGSWDEITVAVSTVVFHDGLYHMFYIGVPSDWSTFEIGYATSTDGLAWEKYPGNPIFKADGTGFDAAAVGVAAVVVEGDTWVLYYYAEQVLGSLGPIGRATAPSPIGP